MAKIKKRKTRRTNVYYLDGGKVYVVISVQGEMLGVFSTWLSASKYVTKTQRGVVHKTHFIAEMIVDDRQ